MKRMFNNSDFLNGFGLGSLVCILIACLLLATGVLQINTSGVGISSINKTPTAATIAFKKPGIYLCKHSGQHPHVGILDPADII
ncbi:MAG TPA: hypothetical protein VLG12_03315 [Candidatus Saccharimonadales bacterium]|nr:hypothetical protein [Candidatus Saccharimonadales bacterium]